MGHQKTELVTFAVRRGKEERAEAWMRTLQVRQDECVQTLDREHMHYESIFSMHRDGRMYLTWFAVQGAAGAHVKTSPFEIDHVHRAFWEECIDREVAPQKHDHVVSFVPSTLEAAIRQRERDLPAASH